MGSKALEWSLEECQTIAVVSVAQDESVLSGPRK